MSTLSKEREPFLDIIRGGAAICIVLYHYTTRYDQMIGHKGMWPFTLSWGWMAWAIFFIMSGYLVYPKAQSISHFVKGKMVRLYPGYWASMCVSFMVTTFYLKEFSTSCRDFVIDLSMIGNYLGAKSVVGVDWTLSVDLIFYALISLIIILKRKGNVSEAKIIALWGIVSCTVMLFNDVGIENTVLKIVRIGLAAQYAHLFLAGSFLRRIKQKIGNRKINLTCVAFSILAHWIAFQSISFELFYCVVIAVFLCFAFELKFDLPRKLHHIIAPIGVALTWIAGISYPLYLVHEYLGFAILKCFENVGMTSEIFIFAPITVSIIVAYGIHKYIECPVTIKIKRKNERT